MARKPKPKQPAQAGPKPKGKARKPTAGKPAPAKPNDAAAYKKHLDTVAKRDDRISRAGKECGPIRPVADPARRERCRLSLRRFCEIYLSADRFNLPWSADHLKAIARIEACVLAGGQFALAMPRGYGKTAILEAAALWAVLFGHRRFVLVVGSTEGAAEEIINSIKEVLETNDLLNVDFPEATIPIRHLNGIANRCKGQLLDGKRTRIEWKKLAIEFAAVPGSPSSRSVLRAVGIDGRIRGMKRGSDRPDLVLGDDLQTDESSGTPSGNKKRLRAVSKVLLKLAGPKKKISALLALTVINGGDMADQVLDPNKNPTWESERFKMVYAFPASKELWEQYANLRVVSQKSGNKGREATEFYRENQAAMDEGAKVAWPENFKDDELSGIQSAMNLFLDDPASFAAECQNAPEIEDSLADLRQITEDDIIAKLNTSKRRIVPRSCNRLTAFIDVQAECLFWMVVGWTESFGGSVVDYGVWPNQGLTMFSADRLHHTLSTRFPGCDEKTVIYKGLAELVPMIFSKQFAQDGASGGMTIAMLGIDIGHRADVVHDYLSRSQWRAMIQPTKGRGIGVGEKPLTEWRRDPGDRVGENWRINAKTTSLGRHVMFDTNRWKSHVCEGILAPVGSPSSIYFPGSKIIEHPLLTCHLLNERREEDSSMRYGKCVKWTTRNLSDRENHWWDCIVGAAVMASVLGIKSSAALNAGESPIKEEPAKKVKLSDIKGKQL